MADNNLIKLETKDHLAIIYLNRPEKRNALNVDMFTQLKSAAETINNNKEIRAAILTSSSNDFSVGLDLSSLTNQQDDNSKNKASRASRAKALHGFILGLQECVSAISKIKVPVIASVSGYCIGGGLDLIAACDLRIAATDTIFSIRETKMAMVADLGSLQRLPFIMSFTKFLEFAYTGKDFNGEQAYEAQLINYVTPSKQAADEKAITLAQEIASNSPLAVQGTKEVILNQQLEAVEKGLKLVALYNAAFLESNDLIEAVSAFFEKRNPNFSGS